MILEESQQFIALLEIDDQDALVVVHSFSISLIVKHFAVVAMLFVAVAVAGSMFHYLDSTHHEVRKAVLHIRKKAVRTRILVSTFSKKNPRTEEQDRQMIREWVLQDVAQQFPSWLDPPSTRAQHWLKVLVQQTNI